MEAGEGNSLYLSMFINQLSKEDDYDDFNKTQLVILIQELLRLPNSESWRTFLILCGLCDDISNLLTNNSFMEILKNLLEDLKPYTLNNYTFNQHEFFKKTHTLLKREGTDILGLLPLLESDSSDNDFSRFLPFLMNNKSGAGFSSCESILPFLKSSQTSQRHRHVPSSYGSIKPKSSHVDSKLHQKDIISILDKASARQIYSPTILSREDLATYIFQGQKWVEKNPEQISQYLTDVYYINSCLMQKHFLGYKLFY
jgi:hypothetical protein